MLRSIVLFLLSILRKTLKNPLQVIFMAILGFLFLVNSMHTQFPDEFDNIYGGFLMTQGKVLYRDFFSHHNPLPYFVSYGISLFTGRSFVLFRIVFALFLLTLFGISYKILKRSFKGKDLPFFLFYGLLLGLGGTVWWGQMLLAETLAGYFLVLPIMLLLLRKWYHQEVTVIDVGIISLCTFLVVLSSMTYSYLVLVINCVTIISVFSVKGKITKKNILQLLLIFIFPYLLYFLYLLITGSLSEYVFEAITYNVKYYIYNYPSVNGVVSKSPIRYIISTIYNVSDEYIALLYQISSFNLRHPVNISLALGNIAMIILLLKRRAYLLSLFICTCVWFSNVRSNPLTSGEGDFQITGYIVISLALGSFFLFFAKDELEKRSSEFSNYILKITYAMTGFYWIFLSFFLFSNFANKAYAKYMGKDPLIYDRSQVASTINKLVSKDEYYWIGPHELQEVLFIQGKNASKYYWFLPAHSRDEKIVKEFQNDLLKNKPKVIIFKKWFSSFGVNPQDFNGSIVQILDRYYFQISDLRSEGLQFKVNVAKERNFDFEAEYYFLKERKNEITQELFDKHLLEK